MGNESLFNKLKKHFSREEKIAGNERTPAETPAPPTVRAEESKEPPPQETAQPNEEKPTPPAAQGDQQAEQTEGENREQEETPDEPEENGDAVVSIWVSEDHMEAYIKVSKPQEGGAHVTEQQIHDEIQRVGVSFGVIGNAIKTVTRLHLYDKGFTVARGVPAKDGENGRIEELFPRTKELQLEADSNGIVDYKNLGLIHDVAQGAVICIMHPPTPSVDGSDVMGKVLKGVDGKPVPFAGGKNTVLSEDGLQMLAAVGGNVVFINGQFCVEDTLRIHDNVDNAVGNIQFSGDVYIEGDVCEGYEVRSGKNVTVKGSVEGATIIAEGDISLSKGMNGMQKGLLQAGGKVNCRFLENSRVVAQGDVTAESILNSDIVSNGKIVVRGRRGIIVGGSCAARGGVEAKVVGAMSHVATEISLGATPEMLAQYQELFERGESLRHELSQLEKDIVYLEALEEKGKLAADRKAMLSDKREIRQDSQEEYDALRLELQQIEEEIENSKTGRLSAMELYPPVKITIAKATMTVQTAERNCAYYYDEGEIKRGTVV